MENDKQPKIFISYCHANKTKALNIESDLEVFDITVVRDERSLNYTDDIESYMKTIRTMDYALVLISDDFLKSVPCMFEMGEFTKDENHKKRILPVIIKDYTENGVNKNGAKIYNSKDTARYVSFWENQKRELHDEIKKLNVVNTSRLTRELSKIEDISRSISDFIFFIKGIKHVSFDELIDTDYKDLLNKIGHVEPSLEEPNISQESLSNYMKESIVSLGNSLVDDNEFGARMHSAIALGKTGNVDAVHYLERGLIDDAHMGVRMHSSIALGIIGNILGVPSLCEALKHDKELGVRMHSALALGKIGDPSAIPALNNAITNDKELGVRMHSTKSLGSILNK